MRSITCSDPRKVILAEICGELAIAKDNVAEYELYKTVERLSKEVVAEHRQLTNHSAQMWISTVDLCYSMLGIPTELFTPMFAVSRISGWSAHRLEELVNNGKIVRPAYKYVGYHVDYKQVDDR